MTDLQELKTNLAAKLEAKNKCDSAFQVAEKRYLDMLEAITAQNPELATAKEEMLEASKDVALYGSVWKDSRKEATKELADYFEEKPEDKDKEPGLSYRLEKEVKWTDYSEARIKKIIDLGHLWLLKVDEEQAKDIVQANAVLDLEDEDGPTYHMPSYWYHILPILTVKTIFKPTISDKKLTD